MASPYYAEGWEIVALDKAVWQVRRYCAMKNIWLLGMLTAYAAGGLIHLLPVIALVVLVIRPIQGRRSIV
jgi:uncharacterized protein DUF5670